METLRWSYTCLLYTSDAADERSSVDLGGRRIIKKKTSEEGSGQRYIPWKNITETVYKQRRNVVAAKNSE